MARLVQLAVRNSNVLARCCSNNGLMSPSKNDVPTRYFRTSVWVSKSGGVLKDGEDPMKLTREEWMDRLSPEVYQVTREHGTESPFSGKHVHTFDKGEYHCVCCGVVLFGSEYKFESGCGWPAFSAAKGSDGKDTSTANVRRKSDNSFGMMRTEVLCKQCNSHLGHVFSDGPPPTGERYCINSVCLEFKPVNK